jgi:TctA family transporter
VFVCLGAYCVSNSITDVWLVAGLGLFGYVARAYGFPLAPVLLGFVLGPMLEEHFRRAMLISRGNTAVFLESPVSAALLILTLAICAWNLWSGHRLRKNTLA